ncbi:MAG TPA: hypothetical protein DEP20_01720 [Fusobacteria bacterium]|nr:hypothetical protein [Fusobacteriota bacterium]
MKVGLFKMLKCQNLRKKVKGKIILDDVSFELNRGERLGIKGDSGAGKSSLALVISNLEKRDSGIVKIEGQYYNHIDPKLLQIVFHNPLLSMNPFMKIKDTLLEASELGLSMLEELNLRESILQHYPSELSGGELSKLSIIRSVSVGPKILIMDEAFASLDSANRELVYNFLKSFKDMTLIIISHNEDTIRKMCTQYAVMEKGRLSRLYSI